MKPYERYYDGSTAEFEDGTVVQIPSVDAAVEFPDNLVPAHRRFYETLDKEEQILAHLSDDPFRMLRYLWKQKGKPELSSQEYPSPPEDQL